MKFNFKRKNTRDIDCQKAEKVGSSPAQKKVQHGDVNHLEKLALDHWEGSSPKNVGTSS